MVPYEAGGERGGAGRLRERPREIETHGRQHEKLGAALRTVLRAGYPQERVNSFNPLIPRMRRVEIQRLILPSACHRDAVDECRIHAEAAIVMLRLAGHGEAPRAVVVVGLRATAIARLPLE